MPRFHGAPVFTIALLLVAPVFAQTPPKPAFEVASVKPAVPRPPATRVIVPAGQRPGGVFERTTTVGGLILYAYDVRDYQLVGGPDWARVDRFDVSARAGREVPPAEMRLMVQSLLQDRFKLVAHEEQREMPQFALVLARADKRLGPNLKKNDDECKRMVEMPAGVPAGGVRHTGCDSMASFAASAAMQMEAPVIDKTGLAGWYEWAFYHSGSLPRSIAGVLIPEAAGPDDPNLPSYTTALQEQLGLKLEATRGPVKVLIIDAVQRPSEN